MDFWLSAVIAILGNLATIPVQGLIDRWNNQAPRRRAKTLDQRIGRATNAAVAPNTMLAEVLRLGIVYVASFFFAVAFLGLGVAAAVAKPEGLNIGTWSLPATGLCLVVVAVCAIVNTAAQTLLLARAQLMQDIGRLADLKHVREQIVWLRRSFTGCVRRVRRAALFERSKSALLV